MTLANQNDISLIKNNYNPRYLSLSKKKKPTPKLQVSLHLSTACSKNQMQVVKLGIPLATSVFHHMTVCEVCEVVLLGTVVWALKLLTVGHCWINLRVAQQTVSKVWGAGESGKKTHCFLQYLLFIQNVHKCYFFLRHPILQYKIQLG